MNVSCFQDQNTINAQVLSDIDGSGTRDKACIL